MHHLAVYTVWMHPIQHILQHQHLPCCHVQINMNKCQMTSFQNVRSMGIAQDILTSESYDTVVSTVPIYGSFFACATVFQSQSHIIISMAYRGYGRSHLKISRAIQSLKGHTMTKQSLKDHTRTIRSSREKTQRGPYMHSGALYIDFPHWRFKPEPQLPLASGQALTNWAKEDTADSLVLSSWPGGFVPDTIWTKHTSPSWTTLSQNFFRIGVAQQHCQYHSYFCQDCPSPFDDHPQLCM